MTPYLGRLGQWAETLKRPKHALIVDVPSEKDDGSVQHFGCFRVQHNLSRGPGKGSAVPPRHPHRAAARIKARQAVVGFSGAERARRITARLVLEGGNGRVVPEADEIPAARDVLVVPVVSCNASGVTVNCFEWVQDFSGFDGSTGVRALSLIWFRGALGRLELLGVAMWVVPLSMRWLIPRLN